MKKILALIFSVFTIGMQAAFAVTDAISPDLEQSLKTHTNEPNFMTIVFALGVVIFLIYITGIIYSKLNIVGAKTVQAQLKNYDLSRVIVVSTTQLGQGKNLHIIELGGKRYLIGATQTSINLIKELGEIKKESTQKPEESNIEEPLYDAMDILYNKDNPAPKFELEPEPVAEFDVHKKYL